MPDGVQLPALPADLDVEHARLPAAYEAARVAIAECARIDECKNWADRAEALASYARQMNDTAMREMADRIQARAIRRAGELLLQVPPATGAHLRREFAESDARQAARLGSLLNDLPKQEGALPLSRSGAATAAGLSEHQRKTALRVAQVPAAEFDAAIERPNPSTVTELARAGTTPRADHLGGRTPEDYQKATRLMGVVRRFAEDCSEIDVDAALRGCWPDEIARLQQHVDASIDWLTKIRRIIGGH